MLFCTLRNDIRWVKVAPCKAGQLRRSAFASGSRRFLRVYATSSEAAGKELTILHFNDVYNIESRPIEPVGGAARFTHAVRSFAEQNPLVLFSGDVFNPSLISAFTRGKQMVPVLNAIGVHAAAVGNHDFDFGLDVLRQHLAECRFPWLLSNVLDRRTGEPLGGALRSHVLSWGGVKVGLLGLVEREWLLTIPSLDEADIVYLDFVEEGRRLARQLWETEGVDFVIALTHMRTHNDLVLAAHVPSIQLVLGGHDHHFEVTRTQPHGTMLIKSGTDFREFCIIKAAVPPVDRQPTPSSSSSSSSSSEAANGSGNGSSSGGGNGSLASKQAQQQLGFSTSSSSSSAFGTYGLGSSFGAGSLTASSSFDSSSGSGSAGAGAAASMAGTLGAAAGSKAGMLSGAWWELVPRPELTVERIEITAATPEDPEVAAIVEEYMALIDTKMDEPLGWTHVDLDARYDRVRCGESNIGNLFADILRIALQADAAFYNGGTIRSDAVHTAGQLCMRDFVSMLPFTDELVLLELSGAELAQALEIGVGSWPQLEGRFLQVSGIRFAFDPSQPRGSRVVPGSVWVAEEPLEPHRCYKVVTKAYLRGGKDGFDCLKDATILMDGETAPRLATLVQYLLTRIQELNEAVQDDYRLAMQQAQQAAAAPGSGAANGGGAGQQQQQQRQPAMAAAGAAVGGSGSIDAPHPAPLHSTASSSSALESEVFLADGAGTSLRTNPVVTASIDDSHVVEHLHGKEHHHSALDCLYSWDPAAGRYGIAPKIEGRIVRVGAEEPAAC